ncbi:hypothetical protein ABNF97_05865 [Plantactinospora sp. B6F1]|uniref:hypothetical protein n=1 Tax=Plantactinospora sp. B6F1 TaxID=3158971 RepID=UPI00102C9A36
MGDVGNLWDLEAQPAALDALGSAWSMQTKQLTWAAETVNSAATQVIGSEAWTGDTADRYDQHRRKLVAEFDDCAELAGKVARALGECAQVLRHNQEMLTREREKLSRIRHEQPPGGPLTFHPADEQETKQVNEAIALAKQIRARVDSELNAQARVFESAHGQLQGRRSKQTAGALRMLNYNIQQGGGGNQPFPWNKAQGTDMRDMGELAQRIIDGKVDVATLQEIFGSGAERLQQELNARAAPGERWEVHFGKASERGHWDDSLFPGGGKEDFGNAVVVRTGDGLTTGNVRVTDLGPGDEGRSATRVRINVDG